MPSDDDPYIQIADDAMHALGNGGPLGSSIVDLFPSGSEIYHLCAVELKLKVLQLDTSQTGWSETGRSSLPVTGHGQSKDCTILLLLRLKDSWYVTLRET